VPEPESHEALDAAVEEAPAPLAERRDPMGATFWVCMGWLGLLAVVAVFAKYLPLQDPNAPNYLDPGANAGPSLGHLLGTDALTRDILSRLAYGARISLVIGIGATAIGIGIGGSLGMLSAYVRGRFDAGVSLVMYSGLAFPAIIAVIAVISFWGRSQWHVILVLGLFSVPLIFRLVRAATLSCATKEYVTAAKSQGATALRVVARDIFPNVAPSLVVYSVFTLGGVIATEGALAFLGFSVLPPTPSWGTLIYDASNDATTNLPLIFAPAIAIFLTLFSLNYVGERFRRRYEPLESRL